MRRGADSIKVRTRARPGPHWECLPDQSAPTAIVPDPFHQGTLFGGSYSGLFESTDFGQTWTLRVQGATTQIAADTKQAVVYANPAGLGIVRSTDGFQTYSPISPFSAALAQNPPQQLQIAGSFVLAVVSPGTDVFITKLDTSGNIVYSTYFGGAAADTVAGIAVGDDGSVYLTGTTGSTDLPVTKGVYAPVFPAPNSQIYAASFVAKLNPDGTLGWSTYFTDGQSVPGAIAVDAGGSVYIGGKTSGGLPTTPGVYETQFQSVSGCGPGNIGFCPPPPTSAFLTKFNAQGSALTFSTYVSQDSKKNLIQFATSIALSSDGDIYFADTANLISAPGNGGVHRMNASGSALLGSNSSEPVAINSIALDAAGNLFATGETLSKFTATPGSFQTSPQPAIPSLPGSVVAGGGTDAFVVKFDSTLSKILAATLLGGEGIDYGQSLAIDPSGRVIVSGYTDSKQFPLRAPFQTSFSDRSGFVAGFDSNLSQLLFSTYLGDTRQFSAQGAVADGEGNLLVAGSTLESNGGFLSGRCRIFIYDAGDGHRQQNRAACRAGRSFGFCGELCEQSRSAVVTWRNHRSDRLRVWIGCQPVAGWQAAASRLSVRDPVSGSCSKRREDLGVRADISFQQWRELQSGLRAGRCRVAGNLFGGQQRIRPGIHLEP